MIVLRLHYVSKLCVYSLRCLNIVAFPRLSSSKSTKPFNQLEWGNLEQNLSLLSMHLFVTFEHLFLRGKIICSDTMDQNIIAGVFAAFWLAGSLPVSLRDWSFGSHH